MTGIKTGLVRLGVGLGLALSLLALPLGAGAQNAEQRDYDIGAIYKDWTFGAGYPPPCQDGEPVEVYPQLSDEAMFFLIRYCASNA